MYLPVTHVEVETAVTINEKIPTGIESLLVVDDEEMITTMMQKMLSAIGYQVETCNSSMDALAIFKRNPGKYDLLISDLTMPDLTGIELIQEIRELRSGFPTILMTGFSGDELEDLSEQQVVLHKPLIKRTLAVAVRATLDRQAIS